MKMTLFHFSAIKVSPSLNHRQNLFYVNSNFAVILYCLSKSVRNSLTLVNFSCVDKLWRVLQLLQEPTEPMR